MTIIYWMQYFRNKDYVCGLKREPFEPLERFIERGYFVAKIKPKNDKEMEEAIKYSRIYINVKYLDCNYEKDIHERLKFLTATI